LSRSCATPVSCVEERDGFKLYECFIDGTFAKAKGGGDGIGCTKAGKGVKIMVLVDARGLPVAVDTCSASPHESQLVQRLFDFMLTEEDPERIIGDKAYDSDKLDDESWREEGIELIAPHRANRKPENVKTQDGGHCDDTKRRWTVERTIGWIQHFRRLCIRWEKSTTAVPGLPASRMHDAAAQRGFGMSAMTALSGSALKSPAAMIGTSWCCSTSSLSSATDASRSPLSW
jgi:transposase